MEKVHELFDKAFNLKNALCVFLGILGGLLGGFDKLLVALLTTMGVDYATGMIVAVYFKKSPKTKTGAAESRVGFLGMVKKFYMLLIIVAVNQFDIVLDTNGFLRNAAIIGFLANEGLSIIENTGLMGIKLPPAVTNAVDILKQKSEKEIQ